MTQSITASKSQQNNPKSAEREAPFVGRLSVGKIGNKPRLSGNSAAVALAAASFSAGGALGGGGLVNFTKLNDAEYNSDLLYATLIVFPKLPLLKRQEFLLSLLREADPMDMDFIFESLPRLHRDFIRLVSFD